MCKSCQISLYFPPGDIISAGKSTPHFKPDNLGTTAAYAPKAAHKVGFWRVISIVTEKYKRDWT